MNHNIGVRPFSSHLFPPALIQRFPIPCGWKSLAAAGVSGHEDYCAAAPTISFYSCIAFAQSVLSCQNSSLMKDVIGAVFLFSNFTPFATTSVHCRYGLLGHGLRG